MEVKLFLWKGITATILLEAIKNAQEESSRPTLICCKTEIGFGSPNKAGTSGVHGSALGEEEIIKTRDQLGWQHEPFDIPLQACSLTLYGKAHPEQEKH